MTKEKVVFTFDDMIASLRQALGTFPDTRTGKNVQYEVMDAASGAFSVFFTQCSSFLSYQKLMQERYGLSNAQTLFGMRAIPSDNQIRNLLDEVDPDLLSPVFDDCLDALKRSHHLDLYRVKLGHKHNDLLMAIDGVTYFSSTSIHCPNCSRKEKEDMVFYSHSMLTPTLVAPAVSKVVSLPPEFILPQDGDKKQDCELKAGKRWLSKTAAQYSPLGVTILGDDLYAHEPFCRELRERGYNFILVCKPDSHKILYEWIQGITREKVETRFDGKKHQIYTYHYVEGIPLKDGEDSLLVNFVEVIVTDRKTGKQLYHNAFITNHPVNEETVGLIVDCGRARWKIENENNNTLKRQGYNLEHNFGHGKKHLAALLATLNILAFLFHTLLEYMNEKYQLLRQALGARIRFFEHLRVLLIHICYESFDHFLDFMISSLEKPHDLETLHFPV
jgi:hypothetical protein